MAGNHKKNNEQVHYSSLNNVGANMDTANQCGCGPFKPSFLQRLVRPAVFTFHAGLIIAVHLSASTYFSGILTTLERQFQLSASEVAALSIINDASMLCVIIFVTHFGQKSHRPRWIAGGAFLIALSLLICAMAHYLSAPIDPQSLIAGGTSRATGGSSRQMSGVCNLGDAAPPDGRNATTGVASGQCEKGSTGGWGPVKWIVLGQVIWGFGGAPLFPLALSYIDDAVPKHKFTSYTAFMFIAVTIGPIAGFFITSLTTSRYVDFDRVPADQIPDIHQYDPRWIGAWWLAFPFFSAAIVVIALPMLLYPKVMKRKVVVDDKDLEKLKEIAEEDQQDEDDLKPLQSTREDALHDASKGFVHVIKGLLLTIKKLLSNVKLLLMCFGAAAETGIGASASAFGVKYMQTQFKTSPATAAFFMGGLTVPSVTIAQIVSAVICRRFKFGVKQCIMFVLVCHFISMGSLTAQMLIGCGNFPVAGVNAPYQTSGDLYGTGSPATVSPETNGAYQPISSCNRECKCPDEKFRPVCGRDNISYITPCHAGCTEYYVNDTINVKEYSNCGCISSDDILEQKATPGLCYGGCKYNRQFAIYLAVTIIGVFAVALTFSPKVYVIFRLVEEDNRSVALGLKSVITKCFAYFPVPILTGMAINSTCILWQYTCGDRGSCWIYDIISYRYLYNGIQVFLKVLSLACFISLFLCIRSSKEFQEKKEPEQSEMKPVNGMNGTHDDAKDTNRL